MPAKKYIVKLSPEEREQLEKASQSNRRSVREKTRARILLLHAFCSCTHSALARILLLADTGGSVPDEASLQDSEIAKHLRCAPLTVSQVRKKAAERGAVAAIEHKEQEKRKARKARKARKLDGEQEAKLIAVTCSAPPEGQKRWSLRRLRERLIEMEVGEDMGTETIGTTLKKTNSSRG